MGADLLVHVNLGINRIRLEFKVHRLVTFMAEAYVLIESDWNLKIHPSPSPRLLVCRINRIRLEFKGCDESMVVCLH